MQWKAQKGWWLVLLRLGLLVWVKKSQKKKKIQPNDAFFSTVGPGGVTGYVWLRAPAAWECGTGSDGAQTGTETAREAAAMTGSREKTRGLTKSREQLISAESFLLSLLLYKTPQEVFIQTKNLKFQRVFCPHA